MDYIEIDLPKTELRPGQDPYPDRTKHDIVEAVYHSSFIEKDNPDVCALPPRIPDKMLYKKCAKGFPGYSREAIGSMKLSERLLALDAIKDHIRICLPYYGDFFRRLLACLLSAYRNRSFAVGRDHFRTREAEIDTFTKSEIGENQVLSVSPPIASSVQSLALVGVAGTGKSTCLSFVLSFFPHAILHSLPGGYKYIQIPVLQASAVNISDTKAFFITLAAQIDLYIGQGNVYTTLMRKKNHISKMLEYFTELVMQFHVGMVVIDEVQMITDKGIFQHLLSLSNTSHVSICLVGTETALAFLHKDTWAKRRFGELGLIEADFGIQKEPFMKSILRMLWRYQFTYTFTDDVPDGESVKLLIGASMGNIDLLSTLFVKAQRIALMDKSKKACLSPDTIGLAVKSIEKAKKLLEDEQKVIATYLPKEKQQLQKNLRKDIGTERAKEASAMVESAEAEFQEKTEILEDLVFRIGTITDYSYKKIEATYDRLIDDGTDLAALDPKQRAKAVLAALQEEEMEKQKKKKKDSISPNIESKAKKGPKKTVTAYDYEAELKNVLSGGIDDITNFSANIS